MLRKRYVGFGFGPIQTGLILREVQASGNFESCVIAEVDAGLVQAVRDNGGTIAINVATQTGIVQEQLTGLRLLNPGDPADRAELVREIGIADEFGTAIPSIDFYTSGGASSIAALLAEGINPERPQILYAAENHNHAAEALTSALRERMPAERMENFQALNTVVGKMSGVMRDEAVIEKLGLAVMTPALRRAVLVEEFNRILITRVAIPGASVGIPVFAEKDDLLPFEEAKLYGHNAVHALVGYLGDRAGYTYAGEVRGDERIMAIAREAMFEECGAALIAKYANLGDSLFTKEGFAAYGAELLIRMTNPYLNDELARLGRDPRRKLSWDDRIVGTIRLALTHGIEPRQMALAGAAALAFAIKYKENLGVELPAEPEQLTPETIATALKACWGEHTNDSQAARVIELITAAWQRLTQPA